MSRATLHQTAARFGPLQIAITALTLVTALFHLSFVIYPPLAVIGLDPRIFSSAPTALEAFGFSILKQFSLSFGLLFSLCFIGYIILAAAYSLPALLRYQYIIRWILLVFVVAVIFSWYTFTAGHFSITAAIDKPIEVLLIILLLVDWQRVRLSGRQQRG